MKAKEHAKPLLLTEDKQEFLLELTKAVKNMISELGDLMKARNVNTDSGIVSCLKDTHSKFKAFVKIVNEKNKFGIKDAIREDALSHVLQDVDAHLYILYINYVKS